MATDHYEVRDTQGGYYNSFESYVDAREYQDWLWNRHHTRTNIIPVEECEVE